MARDMEMDMLIKPVMDTKAFDAGLKRLQKMAEKGVSGLSSRESARFESLASSLISSLVISGRATTATQGRLQIQSALGKMSGQTASVLRGAQNISQIAIQQGRVEKYQPVSAASMSRLKSENAGIAAAWNDTLTKYLSARDEPTSADKESLSKSLNDILAAIKSTGKDQPKVLKSIEKNAKGMSKDIAGWSVARRTGAATALGSFFGNIKGLLGPLLGGLTLSKIIAEIRGSMARGENAITEQMIYGENRDQTLTRTYANLYKMKEDIVAEPLKKAITFSARRISGQLSQNEIIGWARLGLLPYISSGEAAANPRAFYSQIRKNLWSFRGDEATLMSILQQIGVSPELAKMNAVQYSDKQIQDALALMEPVVLKEKLGAMENIVKGRHIRYGLQAFSAAGANLISQGLDDSATASNLQALNSAERNIFYKWASPAQKAIMRGENLNLAQKVLGSSLVSGPMRQNTAGLWGAVERVIITNNNQNTFNIDGGDTEEVKDAILETYENMNLMNLNNVMGNKRTAQ